MKQVVCLEAQMLATDLNSFPCARRPTHSISSGFSPVSLVIEPAAVAVPSRRHLMGLT